MDTNATSLSGNERPYTAQPLEYRRSVPRNLRKVTFCLTRRPPGAGWALRGRLSMLRLLERNIASIEKRLTLLAPSHALIPDGFRNVTADPARHDGLVREIQGLRGRIYLDDGAVQREQLSPEGLHQTPEDARSWHLLFMNQAGRASSCAWYLEHDDPSIEHLRVRNCPLSRTSAWRDRLRAAVESEIGRARRSHMRYAEVGGWAVARGSRCSSEGLLLALAAYSLGRKLGGALGLTTATVRHASSTILKRLGGSHLEVEGTPIPSYFDPNYGCVMELLRFDSRRPNEKYAGLIDLLKQKLSNVPVVAAEPRSVGVPIMATHQSQFAA